MSGALLNTGLRAVTSVAGIGTELLSATGLMPAMFKAPRKIGTIIPDVTIEESHSDRLTVTQHPVASGSQIADHAYKMPATITMRVGFSNSSVISAGVQGFMQGGGFSDLSGGLTGAGKGLLSSFTEERVSDIYRQLLKLQFDETAWQKGEVALQPFTLITGKRTYKTVVITELSVRTDHTTEWSLMVECHMQEVVFVTTSQTTQPAQSDQVKKEQTASPTDQPDKTAQPTEPTGPQPTLLGRLAGVRK
jgi:hypothetical protein